MEEHKSHESQHSSHEPAHGASHQGGASQGGSNPLNGPEMKMPKMDMKDLNVGNAFQKFMGLLKLDKKVIEEVANDEKGGAAAAFFLLVGAVGVPLVNSIIGINILGTVWRPDLVSSLITMVFSIVVAVLVMFITTLIATKLFKGHGTFAQYFRVMGLAYGANVLGILGTVVFSLSMIVGLVVGLWMLAVSFTAIKAIFKLDDTNAVLTLILMVVATFVLMAVVGALGFAGAAGGLGGGASVSGISVTY